MGATRTFLAVLCDAYAEEEVPTADGATESRSLLRLSPSLAPVSVGVFPLVKKDGMAESAQQIAELLQKSFRVEYDASGAIGRRYRRQDEIGTPYCVTIDGETATDGTVTLRDRDTMQQDRISVDALESEIQRRLNA